MALNSQLWIDDPNLKGAHKDKFVEIAKNYIGDQDPELYWSFFSDGFVIIKNAVSSDAIDRYLVNLNAVITSHSSDVLASCGRDPKPLSLLDPAAPLTKILDIHWHQYIFAEPLIFNPQMAQFIATILGDSPLAFQSLHFEVGSTQAVHQDPAYVVINDFPNHFVASWIALEDILPGSGELVYYPGSHRFENFLYGESKSRKHWDPTLDGNEIHDHHLFWLRESAKNLNIELQKFNPSKGDVLIWHSDLAHGGGEILDTNATRRSLVTHYTRVSDTPYYLRDCSNAQIANRIKTNSRGESISSMYY
jgi:phytanoyl-CoA hydroxylase